jgi:hypothetical protein
MSALHGLALRVLAGYFYRRHLIFFSLLIVTFAGLVKPPTVLFSGMVIVPLMASDKASLVMMGVCLAWAVYAGWRLRNYLRLPILEFLWVMGGLGLGRRAAVAAVQYCLVSLPGLGYLGLMAYHGIAQGHWTGSLALGLDLLALASGTALVTWCLGRPQTRPGQARRWLPRYPVGLTHIFWKHMLSLHRSTLLIVKGFSILLIGLYVSAGTVEVIPQMAWLAFVVSAILQTVLPFRLRQTEETEMGWFRSLPIRWWRRHGAFMLVHLGAQLPELILLVLGSVSEGQLPLPALEYLLAVMGMHSLSIGLSYLPQMTGQDFLRLQFAAFVLLFLALIFKLPMVLIFAGLGLTGLALSYWGLWRADGSLEHFS